MIFSFSVKSDKKVEQKKKVLKEQENEERDNEIYEMSRMMREKQRDKRRLDDSPRSHSRSERDSSKSLPYFDASKFSYDGDD